MISIELSSVPHIEIITTPMSAANIPEVFLLVNLSSRKKYDKITMKIGIVVIIKLAVPADIYC